MNEAVSVDLVGKESQTKHDASANIRSNADYYVQQGVNRNGGKGGIANRHHGRSRYNDQVYQRGFNHDINPNFYENNNATYIDDNRHFYANDNTSINRNYNSNANDYNRRFRAGPECGEFNHRNANKCGRKGCIRHKKNY